MASNPMVTYICKRTVVSTKPVQPRKRHSLSVLDRVMGENHLKMVYYLKDTTTPNKYYKPGEITKMLRESISETLTFFPIITGRLVKEEDGRTWMIKCNDAGVRMVEARAQGSVDEWLSNVDREREMKLVHWEEMFHKPYFWSTFYVQLTEFEGGGVAIGLSCYHLLADPVCATMFIKAWADIAFLGKMQHPPFFHPLPIPKLIHNPSRLPHISKTNDLIEHYKATIINNSVATVDQNVELTSHVATLSFSFTSSMVQSCMAMAQTGSTQMQASPFEVLSGLFWLCLSEVKKEGDGLVDMSICLDARKALGLDSGFFGNCMVHNRVQCSSHEPPSISSLPSVVASIREAAGEITNSNSVMGLIEWLRCKDLYNDDADQKESPSPINHGNCEMVCIGLDGVDPYSARFEDGLAPIRVSTYVEPVGEKWQVLILPAPLASTGGGYQSGQLDRVVMVTIPKEFVGSLCRNELIRNLCPDIVMGMNDVVSSPNCRIAV
ncbi:unnamed protein product [Linum tenue]|uniref:Protein ECERIFERUM 26-like n=1 Tax=Linum tenue TaxID=586396 RepID=A0AAV0MVJ8_9ROSI|nr:unnamed protein product [Linum tenue]